MIIDKLHNQTINKNAAGIQLLVYQATYNFFVVIFIYFFLCQNKYLYYKIRILDNIASFELIASFLVKQKMKTTSLISYQINEFLRSATSTSVFQDIWYLNFTENCLQNKEQNKEQIPILCCCWKLFILTGDNCSFVLLKCQSFLGLKFSSHTARRYFWPYFNRVTV